MSSDMFRAASAAAEIFRDALAQRQDAADSREPAGVLAPAAEAGAGRARRRSLHRQRCVFTSLVHATVYQPGRKYFRRCREEMNEGFFACVPAQYFPVKPKYIPHRLYGEVKVEGETLGFSFLPPLDIERRFYKQLPDGTFVRLPFLYPEEYYEDEEIPSCERYFLRADAEGLRGLDPSTLSEDVFAAVPAAINEMISNWGGPRPLPLPHERYVLKKGCEYELDLSEDAFELIETRFLKLDPCPFGQTPPPTPANLDNQNGERRS
ncbi:virion protein V67 [Equid alphaherpesvirus 3]|uniref:Virion protein V67 n=1 Tax=Equid alphaherpesvirus 3 TaxID=80341 RepID=A0A077B632_9ALPH|nr:virion protein V67 [Equid alphaherpesvirus 3]AIL02985.1 virion protein V67 [Equid alphaherpesvirus 3]